MPTTIIELDPFLHSLGLESEPQDWDCLRRLAGLTAMRYEEGHGYFVSNFWRGPLLYSLVRSLRPQNVLELGTGRGYGAFSMAMAARDHGLETKIWTVDAVAPDVTYDWHYEKGDDRRTESFSKHRFWSQEIAPDISQFVVALNGDTAKVARNWKEDNRPPVNLVFIDADHSYPGVRRDFLAALRACSPDAVFVFDDYSSRKGYGVKRLVDEYLAGQVPDPDVTVIDIPQETEYDALNDHRMAVWHSRGAAVANRFGSFMNFERYMLDSMVTGRSMALRLRNWLAKIR